MQAITPGDTPQRSPGRPRRPSRRPRQGACEGSRFGPRAGLLQSHPTPAPSHPVGAPPPARPPSNLISHPGITTPATPAAINNQRLLGLPSLRPEGGPPTTLSDREPSHPVGASPPARPPSNLISHPGITTPATPAAINNQRLLGLPAASARARASYNPIRLRTIPPRRSAAPAPTKTLERFV
jgi:hypothetical protein